MRVSIYKAAILCVFAICVAFPLTAQEGGHPPGGSAGQGIPAGNWMIYPTLELIYQFENNLFLLPPPYEFEDSSYVVRPKIVAELPFLRHYFRIFYSGEYRTYDDYDLNDNWTHILEANARIQLSKGLIVTVRDRFVRSQLYTEEYDKNREVYWGNNPYRMNTMTVDLTYLASPRFSINTGGEFAVISFDEAELLPGPEQYRRSFFDYDKFTVWLGGGFSITPLTGVSVRVIKSVSEQDREYQGLEDDRDAERTEFYIGVEGGLTPTMSGRIYAAYTKTDYDEGSFDPALARGDYSGLEYGVSFDNRFSSQTVLTGKLWRTEEQSSFLGSNYYVATGGTLSLTHNISHITFWSLGLAFQTNGYPASSPVFGEVRDDDISSIKLGLGMYFSERASVRVNYRYEERDSNIPVFNYKSNRYTVSVQAGW